MEFIELAFSEKYAAGADNFFNVYNINSRYLVCDGKMKLKDKKARQCRFCGKSYGPVKFKDNAHILPKSLGNKNLVSDFECDSCNKKFSRYENDLCYFLGIDRTINKTHGYKSIPTFKNGDIRAEKTQIFGHEAIKLSTSKESLYEYGTESNTKIISYVKHRYVPVNVYKAFLKMALCMLDKPELENYKGALNFLQEDSSIKKYSHLYLSIFRLPFSYTNLFAQLFKSSDVKKSAPSYTFILFYKNYQFQIFLPFHKDEVNKKFDAPILPPLFDGSGSTDLIHQYFDIKDMASNEKVENEKEYITIKMENPDDISLVAFNPNTNEIEDAKYSDRKIVGMYILDKDSKLDLPKK